MNQPKLLYNNEAIGLLAILSVLKNKNAIELGKVPLILPFLFDDKIVKKLKRKDITNKDLKDIIISNIDSFVNFNDKFYSFLPKTINILSIGVQSGIFEVKNNYLIFKGVFPNEFKTGSKRAENIIQASRKLTSILETETNQLYFTLRIEI